jgi:hypothetical protein
MPRRMSKLVAIIIASAAIHPLARGGDHKLGSAEPGKPRCIPHTHERAGWPLGFASHIQSTDAAGWTGSYVGGGGPIHPHNARGRSNVEGTWGWDYVGVHLPRRAFIPWHFRPRRQGGIGQYATDYPVEVSDIPSSLRNPKSPPGSILEHDHESSH